MTTTRRSHVTCTFALASWALFLACAPSASAQTGVWSEAPRTEQIDPRRMERAEIVRSPAAFDPRLAGTWELWVPGGVWYRTDGSTVYRRYTRGAAMNRLQIAADGSYTWEGRRGRLVEVRPWHAQPGVRYYHLPHPAGGEYEIYLCAGAALETLCRAEGRLMLLFGGVGGHAATGTRVGGTASTRTAAPANGAARPQFRAGQVVQVEWQGSWYRARILRVDRGRYRVHYEGWADSWDEWVTPDRIRAN